VLGEGYGQGVGGRGGNQRGLLFVVECKGGDKAGQCSKAPMAELG